MMWVILLLIVGFIAFLVFRVLMWDEAVCGEDPAEGKDWP
jgi:hypothetical protein